jgi:hypothetical protein
MRKTTTWTILAGFLILAAGLGLFAAQNKVLDFKLVNKTGTEIYKIFISPADVDEWQEDVLDLDTLEDGATVEVKFNVAENAKIWDLKIEDEDETAIIWEDLDLSQVNVLTLKIVNGKPVAEIK